MKKIVFLCFLLLGMLALPATLSAGTPTTIRIGLTGNFANRESIHIANNSIIAGYDNGSSFQAVSQELHSENGFTARISGGIVALYIGNIQVFSFTDATRGAQVRESSGGQLRLGAYSYRGVIEFRPVGNRITAINVICPEEYLFGVLPMEMSYHFHMEALKAQAIASRTFMMYRIGAAEHAHQGFHLCDGTHCQSYRGAYREHVNTTQAVSETRGLMIYYDNAVILAVYFASSGGSTDNSENVWVQNRPYLRAVQDPIEHDPVTWNRTFTRAQLDTALQNANVNIGSATGLSITQTGIFGRVQELTIEGTAGEHRLRAEAIRTFFTPIGGVLMSRNFYIEGVRQQAPAVSITDGQRVVISSLDTLHWRNHLGNMLSAEIVYVSDGINLRRIETSLAGSDSGLTLNGRGWGHGVGMSQRGAHGMARAGYTYRQILHHFYTNVEIR